MSRSEFSKPTKREAMKRAKDQCEATGTMYGLKPNARCTASLSHGVEFDHIILDANSHDNSLGNCAAVCIPCHRFKTTRHDIPMAAKTVRQRDKSLGISKPKGFWRPAGMKFNWGSGRYEKVDP